MPCLKVDFVVGESMYALSESCLCDSESIIVCFV